MFLFWHTLVYSFLISVHVITSACFEIPAVSKIIARKKSKELFGLIYNSIFSVAVCVCWGVEVFPWKLFWSEECPFSCSVYFTTCALPLPAQGLPECQQHLSCAFVLASSKAWCCQQVGSGRTPPSMPQTKCYCQEAFSCFFFGCGWW